MCVYKLYIEEELLYVFICFSLTVAEAKVTAHSESESAGDLLISVCVLQSFLGGILFPCPFTKVHQGKMCFLNLDSKLQPVFMQCSADFSLPHTHTHTSLDALLVASVLSLITLLLHRQDLLGDWSLNPQLSTNLAMPTDLHLFQLRLLL